MGDAVFHLVTVLPWGGAETKGIVFPQRRSLAVGRGCYTGLALLPGGSTPPWRKDKEWLVVLMLSHPALCLPVGQERVLVYAWSCDCCCRC